MLFDMYMYIFVYICLIIDDQYLSIDQDTIKCILACFLYVWVSECSNFIEF